MDRVSRIEGETSQSEQLGGHGPLYLTIVAGNTSYQLRPSDQVVIAITALSDAAAIIILPSLIEGCGKFYSITAPTGSAAGDISVYEKETGAEFSTYGDLDADDDHVVLYSDGLKWRVILDGVA